MRKIFNLKFYYQNNYQQNNREHLGRSPHIYDQIILTKESLEEEEP